MIRRHEDDVREELARLARKNGGVLTPEAVVEAAKSPDSVLHGDFNWDDKEAAYSWRLDQARRIIKSVRVVVHIEGQKFQTVTYVRDPRREANEQGYVSLRDVGRSGDMVQAVLAEEFARAAAALKRARNLAKALAMRAEIEAAQELIEELRGRVDWRPEYGPDGKQVN